VLRIPNLTCCSGVRVVQDHAEQVQDERLMVNTVCTDDHVVDLLLRRQRLRPIKLLDSKRAELRPKAYLPCPPAGTAGRLLNDLHSFSLEDRWP
jgi:hypothetical protein